MDDKLKNRLKAVRILFMDVDGVLTDGGLYYGETGIQYKRFFVRDGLGIKLLQRLGIEIAFVTGLESDLVSRRAADLGVQDVVQGCIVKAQAVGKMLKGKNIAWDAAAFIGDDLIDVPVMRCVGFAAAVADAVKGVKEVADYVTSLPGGRGAVREVCDLILRARTEHDPDEFYSAIADCPD